MRNLSFTTAKIVSHLDQGVIEGKIGSSREERATAAGILGGSQDLLAIVVTITDVTVDKSLLFSAGRGSFLNVTQARGGTGAFSLTRTFTEGNYLYGTDHISGFVTQGGSNFSAQYCAGIDNLICGIGGHSAGFLPCSSDQINISNCFASIEMYCSRYVGGFLGGPDGTVTNCYVTGKLEGYCDMGGFMFTDMRGSQTITNCYSTVLVGLRTKAPGITAANQMQGGFVSVNAERSVAYNAVYATLTINNAYAAGEVGNYDVDMNNPVSVGGFWSNTTTPTGLLDKCTKVFTNCYYDKQTTAMREWAAGDSKSVPGIKGVLTSGTWNATTKDKGGSGLVWDYSVFVPTAGDPGFTGFSNKNDWLFTGMRYPQLQVFGYAAAADWGSQARADLVRAWSKASTATLFLDRWDSGYEWDNNGLRTADQVSYNRDLTPGEDHKGYKYTYDTVREIVSDFSGRLSYNITELQETQWTKLISGGAPTQRIQNGVPIDETTGITIDRVDNNYGYPLSITGKVTSPGLGWFNVSDRYRNSSGDPWQTAHRPVRLIAYMGVEAGDDATVMAGGTYDHRTDCKFTMMNTLTDNLVLGLDDDKVWSTITVQPYPNTNRYYKVGDQFDSLLGQ